MSYYKCTEKEFLNSLLLRGEESNKFIDEHHYIECSSCGKEYKYIESPVLVDDVWKDVVDGLGLTKLNDEVESVNYVGYTTFTERWLKHEIALYLKTDTTPYCCVCVDCMEKSLHRPLRASDLICCGMNYKNKIGKKLLQSV